MAGWRATFDKKCVVGEGEDARAVFETEWRFVDHRSDSVRLTAALVVALLGLVGYLLCRHDFELYNWHCGRRGVRFLFGVKLLGVKTSLLNSLGAGCARRINRAHGWRGRLLERNQSRQAVNGKAAEAALAEMVTESVADALANPGAQVFSGTPILLGQARTGVHVDRTRMHQRRTTDEAEFTTQLPIVLAQLPHLKDEPADEYRARWQAVADATSAAPEAEARTSGSVAGPYFGDPELVDEALTRYRTRVEAMAEATRAWRAFSRGLRSTPLRYPEGTQCPGALCRALPQALARSGVPPPTG